MSPLACLFQAHSTELQSLEVASPTALTMTELNSHAFSLDDKEDPKKAEFIDDIDPDPDAGLSNEERARIVRLCFGGLH